MIVKNHQYQCEKCHKVYMFEVDKPFSTVCPDCNIEMKYYGTFDCDTELAEKAKNTPPYDPTKDPESPYYIPVIKCPTCSSTNVKKISSASRVFSVSFLGLNSNKINKSFECKTCGYTWQSVAILNDILKSKKECVINDY